MNPPSQDEAVSSSIMKLIANAEKTSLEVQSQTNIIAHEILDISNKLTDKFGVNTSVCIRNIFRPSEKLILSFNSSAAECAQV